MDQQSHNLIFDAWNAFNGVCACYRELGREIMINSLKKSCSLDLIPTHLLHWCLDLTILVIPRITNHSLTTSVV